MRLKNRTYTSCTTIFAKKDMFCFMNLSQNISRLVVSLNLWKWRYLTFCVLSVSIGYREKIEGCFPSSSDRSFPRPSKHVPGMFRDEDGKGWSFEAEEEYMQTRADIKSSLPSGSAKRRRWRGCVDTAASKWIDSRRNWFRRVSTNVELSSRYLQLKQTSPMLSQPRKEMPRKFLR